MLASRSGFSMRGIIPDNAKVSTVTIALCAQLIGLIKGHIDSVLICYLLTYRAVNSQTNTNIGARV